MRPVTRRKLDVALMGVGAVVIGGAAFFGGLAGHPEQVVRYWGGAQLHSDGTASVHEIIDYDFGFNSKHGIYRDIPDLPDNSDITVTSPDAPADLSVTEAPPDSGSYPATRLRIGSPSETVNGRRQYDLQYTLPGVVRGQTMAWNAVGDAWVVPIEESQIDIVAPYQFVNPTCVKGPAGSTTKCTVTQPEPGHLVVHVGHLDKGNGVTVGGTPGTALAATPALAPPTTPLPKDKGANLALVALVGLVGAIIGAAPMSRWVRWRGRERVGVGGAADAAFGAGDGTGERLVDEKELEEMATIEFAPPKELSPAQGGVILAEGVRPEHKVAWLVTQAVDGVIELTDEGHRHVRLHRLEFGDPEAAPLLNGMLGGREDLTLGTYDKTFASGWSALGGHLETWRRSSGLWDPRGNARRTIVRVLGVVAIVIGLAATIGFGIAAGRFGPIWLIGVAIGAVLAGIGIAGALRAWELLVRTPKGTGLWLRVESFRRFLASSEGYHAEEAAKRGVLREYTAWAVAVGEVEHWRRAMAAAVNVPPDPMAMTYASMTPLLLSSTHSASTAPSSSGGGGFGGGSVGGGAGGGGGGSW